MSSVMGGLLRRVIRLGVQLLPSSWRGDSLRFAFRMYLRELESQADGKAALIEMLHMDNTLYHHLGQLAIRVEGRLHPKHRLMNYHAFFTERVGPHERVLDIGCGRGALTYDLAGATDAAVVGIDLSSENVAYAQKTCKRPNLRFLHGDATKGVPAGQFDVLTLSNVWEHIEDRVEFMRRLLAATGARKVLIRVPMFEREWIVPLKKELGVDWRLEHTHCTEFTEAQLRQEIADSGLTLEELVIRFGEFYCRCSQNEK